MKILTLSELRSGMVLAQDVYIEEDPATAYLRRGMTLSERTIERLRAKSVRKVYIEDEAPSKPMVFTPIVPRSLREKQQEPQDGGQEAQGVSSPAPQLQAPFAPRVPSPAHVAAQRAAVSAPPPRLLRTTQATVLTPQPTIDETLRSEAISRLESAFSQVSITDAGIYGSADAVNEMDEVVGKLVHTVVYDRKSLVNLSGLKSYDEFTYHHSLSVAVLSIAIGRQLGFSSYHLNRLGLSAIMHDIGKTAVPLEVIHKPARLDEREFDMIKTHAKAGTSYLIQSSIGDEKLWRAVLFHHEKVNGGGYPNGISGDQIPIWSRIIAVADVYDALTSRRPQRAAMQPADALEYIMGGVGTAFDYDVVQALMHKIDLYPVGSCVELSNGEYALVLDSSMQLRPIVEILGRGDVVDLYSDRQYLNVVVRRSLPPGELTLQQG